MLALLSVWLGLASFAFASAIVLYRRLFSDVGVTITLYAAILSLTCAGLSLWRYRLPRKDACWRCGYATTGLPGPNCPECGTRLDSDPGSDPNVRNQRVQAWVGTALSVVAIAFIYLLIGRAEVVPRAGVSSPRNPPAISTTSSH